MSAERSEAPTQRRRDDARKKGQVSKSQEIVSIGVLLVAIVAMRAMVPGIWNGFGDLIRHDLGHASNTEVTSSSAMQMWQDNGTKVLLLVAPLFAVIMMGGVALNVGQTGLILSGAKLKPKLSHLNPGAGAKRLISTDGLVNLVKAIGKMGIVGVVVYMTMKGQMSVIAELTQQDIASATGRLGLLSYDIAIRAGAVLFILAVADYIWQRRKFNSQLRMTKQEVKQESRESDGDPQIKQAIRRRRQQLMNRMLAAVPKADVIVTNPTHFAVALKYDPVSMAAPMVVAKGQDLVAQRIKEIAQKHGIPVFEEPPLARALHKSVPIGGYIPGNLFHAVAEVLAWVYAIRSKTGGRRAAPLRQGA
jgi:flagellar biosynthetic protein FlhB